MTFLQVHWFEQQVEKRRVKRDFQYYDGSHGASGSGAYFGSPSTHSYSSPYQSNHGVFPDPLWKEQWYLVSFSLKNVAFVIFYGKIQWRVLIFF